MGILLAMTLAPEIVRSTSQIQNMVRCPGKSPIALSLSLFWNLIFMGPAILAALLGSGGVWSSLPPTPPTASAAQLHMSFLKGLKQV